MAAGGEGDGEVADACTNAWFIGNPATAVGAPWTAPAGGGGSACVTFSVAQAAEASDWYHTATVRPLAASHAQCYRFWQHERALAVSCRL
jgi:hypothetical protein